MLITYEAKYMLKPKPYIIFKMDVFHYKYNRFILPLYGMNRNPGYDEELLNSNHIPHEYCIHDRVDMTQHDVYSIDPDGCEDADDAFSIYREDDKLFLAIHIADPTEYIQLNSPLWKDMEIRTITRYPSNNPPIHMMPHDIMEKASLMDNRHGCIKSAVTVTTEIEKNTFQPIGQIKLLFTKIQVKRENSLSYSQAAREFYNSDVIYICLKISESLQSLRKRETKAVVLNEVANSYVTFDNNEPVLYSDTPTERLMKHMIAEFAIFANSFIGEYLKINFHSSGLYRICPAKDWLRTLEDDMSGQELLNEIIINGIKAEYMSNVQSHDLVGAPEYVHFTSPIRRLTDCVCHYLLKYIHLKTKNSDLAIPFTDNQLDEYSNTCSVLSKKMKNNQYTDIKFRMIQVIKRLLLDNQEVTIQYYVSSYKNGFLNIIINKLNNHGIYFSYTLRIADVDNKYLVKTPNTIKITSANAPNKFDQGTLPDLDNIFM